MKWSDGKPFTAHDVKFTADYCMSPEGGCAQANLFEQVKRVEVIDDHTVTVHFKQPVAYPYQAFVSSQSPILPKHQFANCLGARASQCTKENFGPVGTGPFMVTTFQPNDVFEYKANPLYTEKGKPHFKAVTLKGGGSAMDSARAVFETGEYDYAWNLQLAPEVL